MLAILNSLNAHNYHIFQLILMIFVSKFMVHKALSYKTYLSLGLLSPLTCQSVGLHGKLFTCLCHLKEFRSREGPTKFESIPQKDFLKRFWRE